MTRESGLTMFVYFDDRDRVAAFEFGNGADSETVRWSDIEPLKMPATEVCDRIRSRYRVVSEDGGYTFHVREMRIYLWRPVIPEDVADPVGQRFESVLLGNA